jgi:hypothetical protein
MDKLDLSTGLIDFCEVQTETKKANWIRHEAEKILLLAPSQSILNIRFFRNQDVVFCQIELKWNDGRIQTTEFNTGAVESFSAAKTEIFDEIRNWRESRFKESCFV